MSPPLAPPAAPSPTPRAVHPADLAAWKRAGRRFTMVTAYDHPTAQLLDRAGVPVLLVGDSLGMVVLGHDTTLPVTLRAMLHHAAAVARGASRALLVGDLPFLPARAGLERAARAAGRLLSQGGMHAVKLEGGGPTVALTAHLVARGIPVMAHLGLTPQSVHGLGGWRVQGRGPAARAALGSALRELEDAGAFAVVLEGMPAEVGADLTRATGLPTIGIGAGPGCDGQVLVLHDLIGLTVGPTPRFARAYAEVGAAITRAALTFQEDVAAGRFPDAEHSYP